MDPYPSDRGLVCVTGIGAPLGTHKPHAGRYGKSYPDGPRRFCSLKDRLPIRFFLILVQDIFPCDP
jgi:hypothetical protein